MTTITGDGTNNNLVGTNGDDTITGLGGNDILSGDNRNRIALISSDAAGIPANDQSAIARTNAFSSDGNSVVFTSFATNLIAGDTNNTNDVFVKNLVTGAVTLVSSASDGAQANAGSNALSAQFSPDGTKVVFLSNATNLVTGDTNNRQDLFIKDLTTGATTLVTTDSAGAQTNGNSTFASFSPDGTKIAFVSSATNLVAGDTNALADVFVKDLATGAVTRISTESNGSQSSLGSATSATPIFSPDGTKVAFLRQDASHRNQIFLKDLQTGVLTQVTTAADGTPADGLTSQAFDFSPDGGRIVFASAAENLVPGGDGASQDVFIKDLTTGAVTRVSTAADGTPLDYFGGLVGFTSDGNHVVFGTFDGGVAPQDTNHSVYAPLNPGGKDYFLKDLATGALTLLTANGDGVPGNADADVSSLSSDGTKFAFASFATNLGGPPGSLYAVSLVPQAGGNDTLDGGAGDDVLTGGGGNDSLIGGADNDTASYEGALTPVNASLATNTASGSDIGGDTLSGIENLIGGASDDILTGAAGDNMIWGRNGNDILSGGANNDILRGEGGDDLLSGGEGNDILVGDNLGYIAVASADANGLAADDDSLDTVRISTGGPAPSANGTLIAFTSWASDLAPGGDSNGLSDIYIRGGTSNTFVTRVSAPVGFGAQSNGLSFSPALSPDRNDVAFESSANNLVLGDTNNHADIFIKDIENINGSALGNIVLASTAANGTLGDGYSHNPVFGDWRNLTSIEAVGGGKIAYTSTSSNLVAGDTNGVADIFVATLSRSSLGSPLDVTDVVRVSTAGDGAQTNGASGSTSSPVAFSPDFTKIAFVSSATNLVTGDTNAVDDIFLKDLTAGAITRISAASNGAEANGSSTNFVFSPDGSKIAFASLASNLVAGDTNAAADIFIKDLTTGAVSRVSTASDGSEGNGSASGMAGFADHGTKLVFSSSASNLVPGDTNGFLDVFVKDLVTGAVARLSVNNDGIQGDGPSFTNAGAISDDGDDTVISFVSSAKNLVPGIASGFLNVYTVVIGGGDDQNSSNILNGGPGDDYLNGAGGDSTASYVDATGGVNVNLNVATQAVGGGQGTDTLVFIRNLTGGSFADGLIGDAHGNVLDGGANPGNQGDILLGGAGDDTYIVDSPLDFVDEGNFPAFAQYGFGGSDTIVSTADFFWDLYSVGERLVISPDAVDPQGDGTTAVGSVFDNEMVGNDGTNILFGRGGSDTYLPGGGIDYLSFSTLGVPDAAGYTADGVNTLVMKRGNSYDIVYEFESGKDKIDLSDFGLASSTDLFARGFDDGLGNSYFVLGNGFDYLYMVGLTKSQLSAGDFILGSASNLVVPNSTGSAALASSFSAG